MEVTPFILALISWISSRWTRSTDILIIQKVKDFKGQNIGLVIGKQIGEIREIIKLQVVVIRKDLILPDQIDLRTRGKSPAIDYIDIEDIEVDIPIVIESRFIQSSIGVQIEKFLVLHQWPIVPASEGDIHIFIEQQIGG